MERLFYTSGMIKKTLQWVEGHVWTPSPGATKDLSNQVWESVETALALNKSKLPYQEALNVAKTKYWLEPNARYLDWLKVQEEDFGMLAYHGFLPPRFKYKIGSKTKFQKSVREYLKMSPVLLTEDDFIQNPDLMNNFICFFDIPNLWHKPDPFFADFLHGVWGALWTEEENTQLAKKIQKWLTYWTQTSEYDRSLLWDDLLNLLYTAYVRLYWHKDITKNHDLFR